MIAISKKSRVNIISIVLIGSVIVLLLLGGFNLFLAQKNKDRLNAMLVGSPIDAPLFYLNRFIFPESIEIPFRSTHVNRYQDAASLFPPSPTVIKATSRDFNGSDTLTIEFVGTQERNVFKCDGTPLSPAEVSQSLYFISPLGNLACAEIVNGEPDHSHAQVVVKNIDALRILYGVDSDNDNSTNQYAVANTPEFELDKIITIKVSMLLRTFEKGDANSTPKFYTLDDTEFGPFSDGYLRKTITMVLPTRKT